MGTYDRSNRLITSNGASYYYDHNNKRIWKKRPDGVEEYYVYLGDQRLGTYTYNSGTYTFSTTSTNHQSLLWQDDRCAGQCRAHGSPRVQRNRREAILSLWAGETIRIHEQHGKVHGILPRF